MNIVPYRTHPAPQISQGHAPKLPAPQNFLLLLHLTSVTAAGARLALLIAAAAAAASACACAHADGAAWVRAVLVLDLVCRTSCSTCSSVSCWALICSACASIAAWSSKTKVLFCLPRRPRGEELFIAAFCACRSARSTCCCCCCCWGGRRPWCFWH